MTEAVAQPVQTETPKPQASITDALIPKAATAAPATVEAKPAPKPGKTPDKAALSREMEILKQKNALKAERAKLDEDKAALRAKAASDPLSVLTDLGIDFNKVALAHMDAASGSGTVDVKALEAEIRTIKADTAKQLADADEKRNQEQIQAYVKDVIAGVTADAPTKYPAIALFGAYNMVVDEIGNHYNNTQTTIVPAEAAKIVNDRIVADLDSWVKTNPDAAKFLLTALGGTPEPAPVAKEKPKGVQFRASKTLAGAPEPSPIPTVPPGTGFKTQASKDEEFYQWRKRRSGG